MSIRLTDFLLDAYGNNNGFSPKLSQDDSVAYIKGMAAEAQKYGMS